MMRLVAVFLLSVFTTVAYAFDAEVSLNAPKDWECIDDPEQLPKKVQLIYIGPAKARFNPSLNLAVEETDMPLQEYVHTAKEYHESVAETQVVALGNLQTRSGTAILLQIDRPTNWGAVRFIQATIVKDNVAYVMTATCLQEEFGDHCSAFFDCFKSFEVKKPLKTNH
ncbi:MAG: hypothetical protein ACKVOH_05165 [Chlamydiales bacterium]